MRTVSMALVMGMAALVSVIPVHAQENMRLADVRAIYVDDLGSDAGADLIREKIKMRLVESGRFTVVESPGSADAILAGAAAVHTNTYGTDGDTHTARKGRGVFRLIEPHTQEVIWITEIGWNFGFGSAESKVAKKTVNRLLKATKLADQGES